MSLEKAIKHGKEHRRSYAERGKAGRYDISCRPHGGSQYKNPRPCKYCERNRLFHVYREEVEVKEQLKEIE